MPSSCLFIALALILVNDIVGDVRDLVNKVLLSWLPSTCLFIALVLVNDMVGDVRDVVNTAESSPSSREKWKLDNGNALIF